MSNEFERRILNGIPFFVAKSAAKDARIAVFSWSPERYPLGFYDGSTGRLDLDIPVDAIDRLRSWRGEQAPRSRAQLRVGR